jgi:hypothetical protein
MAEKRNSGRTGRRRLTLAQTAQRGPKAVRDYQRRYRLEVVVTGKAEPEAPRSADDLRDPPDWLTAEQKKIWRYIIEAAAPGALPKNARGLVVSWVTAEDRHRIAEIALQDPALDPHCAALYLKIIERSARLMLSLERRLGFSPASRGGILPL